jgi:hypothetical protein
MVPDCGLRQGSLLPFFRSFFGGSFHTPPLFRAGATINNRLTKSPERFDTVNRKIFQKFPVNHKPFNPARLTTLRI